jgi:hypothetical protein
MGDHIKKELVQFKDITSTFSSLVELTNTLKIVRTLGTLLRFGNFSMATSLELPQH